MLLLGGHMPPAAALLRLPCRIYANVSSAGPCKINHSRFAGVRSNGSRYPAWM